MGSQTHFKLQLQGNTINVTEHAIGKQKVFRVAFSDNRAPLVVSKAKGMKLGDFWTSIPEGRQQNAEAIGELIDDYFRKLK